MRRCSLKDVESIAALAERLRGVILNRNAKHDPGLLSSLTSQSALAGYSSPCGSILSMSLNHQKQTSFKALGSYEALDRLRTGALQALKRTDSETNKRKRPSRVELEQRASELRRECQTLLEELFLLQRAYDIRCQQARRYAEAAGDAIVALCTKEQREVDKGLSLRRIPREASNVISFKGERRDL